MWIYTQSTGELWHDDQPIAIGYSGFGEGKNNPALEAVHGVGPIPRGFYDIGAPTDVDAPGPLGAYVLRLTPRPGTDTHGREGFWLHGDAIAHPGSASHGCIIAARWARMHIGQSGDTLLRVIA